MSMPTIPDINPVIGITVDDSINMLISSIALEEIGLSHIINAEAEKIQYVLGTLNTTHDTVGCKQHSVDDLLKVNRSIDRTLREVLKNQMILHMKFEDSIEFYYKTRTTENAKGIRVDVEYGN
ncbi:hypothetical protein [uncultured Clostridium sp.]|jgi:hypothetical protein|uniref:hypothetical protein n=1 Tax=uncultured Clostridium sp. TaxID=59620 RepID=UPI002634AB6A|nr:hypothetical protein [uncultured Clostridium sp.]